MGNWKKLVDWLAGTRLIKRPRFWTEEEWCQFSNKEKVWICYKHILNIKGHGSGEVDIFVGPVKEFILYGGIILANILAALVYLHIEINYFIVLGIVCVIAVVGWIINFVVQCKIGNWKNDQDFIALEADIEAKRHPVFREIRQHYKEEQWRKNARLLYKKAHKKEKSLGGKKHGSDKPFS